jgi:hypothetical protein
MRPLTLDVTMPLELNTTKNNSLRPNKVASARNKSTLDLRARKYMLNGSLLV